MGLDAALDVVPDRTDGQFAFEGSESGFHLSKLDVLTPEGVGIHGIEISAQQIGALAQLGSPQARLIPRLANNLMCLGHSSGIENRGQNHVQIFLALFFGHCCRDLITMFEHLQPALAANTVSFHQCFTDFLCHGCA